MGLQPITQQLHKYVAGVDFARDFTSWLDVQNGVDTGLRVQYEANFLFLHNGRRLATLTHEDALFQEYFAAFLVLAGTNANASGSFSSGGAPVNPGNPYVNSKTQNGFGTFGGPDFSVTLGAVATKALNAVWYQKLVRAPAPAPGSSGRSSAPHQDWPAKPHRRSVEQPGSEVAASAAEL